MNKMKTSINEYWFIMLWCFIIGYNFIFFTNRSLGWIILSSFMLIINIVLKIKNETAKSKDKK
jgi:hypothetical protein